MTFRLWLIEDFTIKDQLSELGVELNIPPFLDGRTQLPLDDVKKGIQLHH